MKKKKVLFYTTCVGRCVFILSVLEKFAQSGWLAASCCSCAFAATLCILHWHYSEVGGHFGSWGVLERVPRTQRPVSSVRSVLTVELSTPQGRKKKKKTNSTGSPLEDTGGSEESRLTTTQLSLQLQCFLPSVQCDPVSSWLWSEKAASGTWGRPKSRSVFPHSPCSFPSLFTPPSSLTNANVPCDPLFTIWTECSSHYSASSHSHLCIAQENKVSVKETKVFWILLFE